MHPYQIRFPKLLLSLSLVFTSLGLNKQLNAEAMLQYFNTSWAEIANKMPELAEAGYSSLWLPPPTKGSGAMSAGYDLWDPFDLGNIDQRGTVRTRYGTLDDLQRLIETAHRFGFRIYFDNIMNHRAFDVPGFNENTPIDVYPGMVPEDFHLRVTEEGFYRKWDNTRNWGDQWQVQNLGLADLIDIAHETPNTNFGRSEGDDHPKINFVRHPENPEYYAYLPGTSGTSHAAGDGQYVGFGPDNGITEAIIAQNEDFYREDVNAMLIRAARWKMDTTKADGLRLDAVKHVPSYFFGQQSGAKDGSNAGYLGQVQVQYNLTRGFSDWDNHRDTVFNSEVPRDDALVFGEHLGSPPGYQEYIDSGMRLLDAPLHREMNNRLGNPWTGLDGLDSPGWSGHPAFNDATAISFAQSHDDDYANRRELQHAFYLTRRGLANVYTDGYYKAETLGESGGAFPRHANNAFLGQFGDLRLPNLLKIREDFARGEQIPQWSDGDVVAYERRDKRENPGMSDPDGTVLLFMMNDNYASGAARPIATTFPSVPGGSDAYLYNYSTYNGGFFVWASEIAAGNVVIPPGGYFAFSWKNPDPSNLWQNADGPTVAIYEAGEPVGEVRVTRRDGPDGDPEFNPLGLPNRGYPAGETPEPYTYQTTLPRVTDGSDLRFAVYTDGSTESVQLKLNGGVDINSHLGLGPQSGDLRDNPPAIATDTFLGYEATTFRHRQFPEKFAAVDSTRNQIGSTWAETYQTTVGSGSFTVVDGPVDANVDYNNFGGNVASFIYHDPAGTVGGDDPADPGVGDPQFAETGNTLTVWAKTNSVGEGFKMVFYYTLDGSNPEGAGGEGIGSTRVASMGFQHNDDGGSNDWWGSASIPKPADGTELRYKIGIYRDTVDGSPAGSVFPSDPGAVDFKRNMLTVFDIDGFDATTAPYYVHNDYGEIRNGLAEGFHVLRGRAYLDRFGRSSIFNTFTQPFYYDNARPSGEILFPANDGDTVGGQQYGVVVRTDATVSEVWYHIVDGDPDNDDTATGSLNGNGDGFEPFTDVDRNGQWDPGEPFEDINGNEIWDEDLGDSWVKARSVTPTAAVQSDFPREWRFNYNLIPPTGNATIRVRLVEISSTPRSEWTSGLSDVDGHFTTLNRSVNTAGPDIRLLVGWPQNDGDVVGPGYTFKAYFSKSLADGLSSEQLIENFTLRIFSQESGSFIGEGAAQNRENYSIVFDETADFHALALDLPNLFNGDPDWLHGIEVSLRREGEPTLTSRRFVRAFPTPPPPLVDIVNPLEIDSDGRPVEIVLPSLAEPTPEDRQFIVRVKTGNEIDSLDLAFNFAPEAFTGALTLRPDTVDDPNPVVEGDVRFYDYVWSDIAEGQYRMTATVTRGTETNSVVRNARVFFRQIVELDDSGDSDDDGITDALENEQVPLPEGNPETWTNGEVHLWFLSGKTSAVRPASDGSLLSDGLQVGLGGPIDPTATDTSTDTDGDGFANFLPDLDPPVFNTTDNNAFPRYDLLLGRTDLIAGSVTDPVKADTDDDGLEDHAEDWNRNGRVDIGLLNGSGKVDQILEHPNVPTFFNTSRVDRDALPGNAVFLETDPNHPDTIGDGLSDGQADANENGRVDVFLLAENGDRTPVDYTDPDGPWFQYNRLDTSALDWDAPDPRAIRSRALDYAALLADYAPDGSGALQDAGGWPRILITETDPLRLDTTGDGLPDGWKVRYGFDPLDDGVYNWRTGGAGDPDNGPLADLTGDGITNIDHFNAGTDPRSEIVPGDPPDEQIIIGPGPSLGTINGVTYFQEFADWKRSDLIALDEYEGDGFNNQGGDLFPGFDGADSSRDIVAFYARDGGDSAVGGDDAVYFRLDFDDLRPFAEVDGLNIYVAINANPGVGERVLPDGVDTLTDMRWRTVLAVYDSANGRVYVDSDPGNNTDNFGGDLFDGNGVAVYDQDHPKGFLGAYFNSELDAVEFAVSREALMEGGWLGSDFGQLRFQVYTTRPGTGNSPPGDGDLGGRSDLRDSIYDDRIVEDNFFSQAGREDILKSWFSAADRPAENQNAKLVLLAEGNQALLPGHEIQEKINDDNGAGYHRLALAHDVFQTPLALAITPTLASAIQWAAVDPALEKPWRDGPSFNLSLAGLAGEGHLDLLGSTFAGHIPNYTTIGFDADNIETAHYVLSGIYGLAPSTEVFYLPERTADEATLARVRDLGFTHTLLDQREHIEGWFGRTEALGDNGYRINRIEGLNTLNIADELSRFHFDNTDGGAPVQIRRLLSRKSRSEQQEQVVVLLSTLDDFTDLENAEAYQRNLRWYANRPWIEITTPSEIVTRNWSVVDRVAPGTLPLRSKNFIQYASQGSYHNWYLGNADREGLADKVFERTPGNPLPEAFGQIGSNGLADATWQVLEPIDPLTKLGTLAHATAGAALFTTAFHNQSSVDLRKFSTGEYLNPASGYETLAGFAATAQAHFRHAAVYATVANWAATADPLTEAVATTADLTLDGNNNYLLYNRRVFAVFDRLGGRLLASWARDPDTGRVFQTTGNLLSFADGPDDLEGATNGTARRTSAFKDWFAAGSESSAYVNDPYTVAAAPGGQIGWTFTSSDGLLSKTITLGDEDNILHALYDLDDSLGSLFVRFGLSPDLEQLLLSGQSHLTAPTDSGTYVQVATEGPYDNVAARIHYAGVSFDASWVPDATDDPADAFDTVPLRNQAQTQQLEFSGSGQFSLGLELRATANASLDSDADGLPDWWEELHFGDATAADPTADPDGDGLDNEQEFIFGTNPNVSSIYAVDLGQTPNSDITLQFQSIEGRQYSIEVSDNLSDWTPVQTGIVGDGSLMQWTDDGSLTGTHPQTEDKRFYRIRVEIGN